MTDLLCVPMHGAGKTTIRTDKRQIVEQTLKPGASVSRIARAHDINANQVFGWRKLYREGLLGTEKQESSNLVAVTVTQEDELPRMITPR